LWKQRRRNRTFGEEEFSMAVSFKEIIPLFLEILTFYFRKPKKVQEKNLQLWRK
jgi:hypothetical protein